MRYYKQVTVLTDSYVKSVHRVSNSLCTDIKKKRLVHEEINETYLGSFFIYFWGFLMRGYVCVCA